MKMIIARSGAADYRWHRAFEGLAQAVNPGGIHASTRPEASHAA
jgi:hypothetical protein